MRRITIWITGTLAVVALAIAFQLNVAGIGGKEGEENGQRPGERPSVSEDLSTTQPVEPDGVSTPPPADAPPAGEVKPGGDTENHEDKPGESK